MFSFHLQLLFVVVVRQDFRVFHRRKRHQRFEAFDFLDLADGFEQKLLVGWDVFADDLHQEIGFAGDDIAFRDFVNLRDFLQEVVQRVFFLPGQRHEYEGFYIEPHLLGVHLGVIALYDVALFQLFNAFQRGSGGETDFFGEVEVGDLAVFLEDFQDFQVYFIQFL